MSGYKVLALPAYFNWAYIYDPDGSRQVFLMQKRQAGRSTIFKGGSFVPFRFWFGNACD
jgi:hypothetical protein